MLLKSTILTVNFQKIDCRVKISLTSGSQHFFFTIVKVLKLFHETVPAYNSNLTIRLIKDYNTFELFMKVDSEKVTYEPFIP